MISDSVLFIYGYLNRRPVVGYLNRPEMASNRLRNTSIIFYHINCNECVEPLKAVESPGDDRLKCLMSASEVADICYQSGIYRNQSPVDFCSWSSQVDVLSQSLQVIRKAALLILQDYNHPS